MRRVGLHVCLGETFGTFMQLCQGRIKIFHKGWLVHGDVTGDIMRGRRDGRRIEASSERTSMMIFSASFAVIGTQYKI